MQLIQTVTVGAGGAASIEFTGIPQDGTDLLLVVSARNTSTGGGLQILENGNTSVGANRSLTGDGSGASSASGQTFNAVANTNSLTANTFGSTSCYITNYTATATKSMSIESVQETNATSALATIVASNTFGTAAITSLTLRLTSNTFAQHSTASLYKITKA